MASRSAFQSKQGEARRWRRDHTARVRRIPRCRIGRPPRILDRQGRRRRELAVPRRRGRYVRKRTVGDGAAVERGSGRLWAESHASHDAEGAAEDISMNLSNGIMALAALASSTALQATGWHKTPNGVVVVPAAGPKA